MSSKRQAVISSGLYQFIGTIDECLAVDEVMQKLKQVSKQWVHDECDNVVSDPLPNTYWTICSEPRAIAIDFVDRDATVIAEDDKRHQKHLEYRNARWDAESKESKASDEETSDDS